jgi:hypothetical protein
VIEITRETEPANNMQSVTFEVPTAVSMESEECRLLGCGAVYMESVV